MKMTGTAFLVFALAQQPSQDRFGSVTEINWDTSVTPYVSQQKPDRVAGKKYLFVYVRTPQETQEPNFFGNIDIVNASQSDWAFIALEIRKDDPWQKSWGIQKAPSMIGCDIHGNAFAANTSINLLTVRNLLRTVPDAVARYLATLKADFAASMAAFKNDPARGAKGLVHIAVDGKRGYKEVDDAVSRLREIAADELKQAELAESVGPDAGIEFLEKLVKTYLESPPGVLAEIRIAKLEVVRGNAEAALRRLDRIAGYDARLVGPEIKEAAKLYSEIAKARRESIKPPEVKAPEPAPSAVKDAEKEIRTRLRTEYAEKGADSMKALARGLLREALDMPGSPVSRFVLLRDARDLAVQAGDIETAAAAVDETALWFSVNPAELMALALAAAGRAAKGPEAHRELAQAWLSLVEKALAVERYDDAAQAASKAESEAKAGQDVAGVSRALALGREISAIQKEAAAVKVQRQTLATKPEDPAANLAVGLFLCAVRGEWEKGLPFLTKGMDGALKELAVKDLSKPADPPDQMALGDGWWYLSEKEAAPIRRGNLRWRSAHWYVQCSEKLTGLNRIRVESRIKEFEATASKAVARAAVDILKLIDLKADTAPNSEPWRLEGGILSSPAKDRGARVQLPVYAPDEYDVTLVVKREDSHPLLLGLTCGDRAFMVAIDFNDAEFSAIGVLDGDWPRPRDVVPPDKILLHRGAVFTDDKPATVVCAVRKNRLHVTVDGATILDWKGIEYDRLSVIRKLAMADPKALILGAWSVYHISKITITPLSGPVNKIR